MAMPRVYFDKDTGEVTARGASKEEILRALLELWQPRNRWQRWLKQLLTAALDRELAAR